MKLLETNEHGNSMVIEFTDDELCKLVYIFGDIFKGNDGELEPGTIVEYVEGNKYFISSDNSIHTQIFNYFDYLFGHENVINGVRKVKIDKLKENIKGGL